VPDGVGAQDFAKHLVDVEHLPPALLRYTANEVKDGDGDD
jgi:hypothetical protein